MPDESATEVTQDTEVGERSLKVRFVNQECRRLMKMFQANIGPRFEARLLDPLRS